MAMGTVLFWIDHTDGRPGGFGFIKDDSAPDNREANCWFGPKALAGLTVKSGDRVGFDISPTLKPGRGPQAVRVWLREERQEITTLQGEFDT